MTKFNYTRKVINQGGYVVMTPQVSGLARLFQQATIDPYAESELQEWPLGTKLIQGERVWRYCRAGGTGLNIAAPCQAAIAVHADQSEDIAVGVAAAIGDTVVSLTSTANLDGSPNDEDNNFRDAYLLVNDAAGEGQMYKVKSNGGFSGTDEALFTLFDPLTIALTTSSQCSLMLCPYDRVIATTAVMTGVFAGIPQIAVTADYYFWIGTGGPMGGVPKEAIPIGDQVVVGTTAALINKMAAFTTETIIGWAMTPAIADTESFMVFLTGDR